MAGISFLRPNQNPLLLQQLQNTQGLLGTDNRQAQSGLFQRQSIQDGVVSQAPPPSTGGLFARQQGSGPPTSNPAGFNLGTDLAQQLSSSFAGGQDLGNLGELLGRSTPNIPTFAETAAAPIAAPSPVSSPFGGK